MVVIKTIMVVFQTMVDQSIFITVQSGIIHALNAAFHLARSAPTGLPDSLSL